MVDSKKFKLQKIDKGIDSFFPKVVLEENTIPFDFSRKLTALQRPLYAYILTLLPNRTEAEDILQETNLILCRKAGEYDPEGHFQGWAFNIARFQVMGHMSKHKRSKLYFSPDIIENLAEEAVDSIQMDLSRRALQVCYELLPKHMKAMAKLRFREDKSLLEISRILKRPMGSVSATLHRIRLNLISCVKDKIPRIEAEMDA
jgi:RNA polymerase sigma-70 factor (ECF subfamily)